MSEVKSSRIELSYTLPKINFLSSLPEEELNRFAGSFKSVSFRKGEAICREGEPGNSLFIIRSGLVNVCTRNGGQDRILAQLYRGDFFGERAILTGEPRMATVIAVLDTDLFELEKREFERLLLKNPSLALHIARVLSSRLNRMEAGSSSCSPCFFSLIGSHHSLGCSSLAAVLAQSIVSETGKAVLAVDLDEPRGSVRRLLGGQQIDCPDPRLTEDLSSRAREELKRAWFRNLSGITILELPHTDSKEFAVEVRSRLSSILEILKSNFDFVLFDLHSRINPVIKRVLRLSDAILFLISNLESDIPEIRTRLQQLSGLTRPGLVSIKTGISHMKGLHGLCRAEIGDRLKLSEVPDLYWGRDVAGNKAIARKLARDVCKKRIGIALGAGGARGWAHLGVLKVLDAKGIPVDMMAGCSIGAFAGALYSKTGSAEAATELALSYFASSRLVKKYVYDYALSGGGLLKGNRILEVLREMLGKADFMDLQIPLSIIAVDMGTGQEVILEQGPVAEAVRASISSPGMFSPLKLNNRWLTDGAVLNPLPVNTLINKGANIIIASVVESKNQGVWPESGSPSVLGTLARSFSIMFSKTASESVTRSDIAIYPDVRGFKWGDFHEGKELIKRGEEACLEKIDEIERLVFQKD